MVIGIDGVDTGVPATGAMELTVPHLNWSQETGLLMDAILESCR